MTAVCFRIAISVMAGALIMACGSKPKKVGQQPGFRTSQNTAEVEASSEQPDSQTDQATRVQPVVFAPASAASAYYNDPPVEPAPATPLGDAIVDAINRYYADADTDAQPPTPDGRLFKAASELSRIVPEDAPLAYPLVEFAMQRHGIIEPSPHILVIWGPLSDPTAIISQLEARLPEVLSSGPFARIGVGSAPRKEYGEGAAILALQASFVTTKPIPRALPDGGFVKIDGRVHADFRKPEVFVTREDGSVNKPKLKTSRSGSFRTEVSCAGRQGKQQIEITAVDASGSNVLANFPVWCNERAPTSITLQPSIDDTRPVNTTDEAEALMLELVNRDRKHHSLPPLKLADDVSAVARAHSQEMKDTGVVAHVSPVTGSAADRVKRAGIRTSLVLENVARAYGVAEAEGGLMNSPGHRANLLSDLATHIGIGIVFGEVVAGRREMFVAQVFTRIPPPIKPAEARKRIYQKIREHGGARHDKKLTAFAHSLATDLASGVPADKASVRTSGKLDTLASRFSRVTSAITTVSDVEAFDASTVFNDNRISHYGLGVAQGSHKEIGEGAIYIVILLAQAR